MKNGLAAVGMCAWDHFLVSAHYPGPGEYTIVTSEFEQAGGTTSNTCAALGLLGLEPMLASCVGDDEYGEAIIQSLADAGCDVSAIRKRSDAPTDRSVIVISGSGDELDRTIFWIQGARPAAGEQFPVNAILDHRWVLLDVDDARLRQFWLDLPAHLSPRTRLIGTMIYLVDMPRDDGWRQAIEHDVIFGNRREFLALTGADNLEAAITIAQREMLGNACELLLISLGHEGSLAIRATEVTRMPAFRIDAVDTTGAGDAFSAGCIWGLLDGLDDAGILKRGNVIGGLACTEMGARAGLPDREAVEHALATFLLRDDRA
ncbi:MAG: carbohydrate kinase family protein [Thermomicrobiales bacterium]